MYVTLFFINTKAFCHVRASGHVTDHHRLSSVLDVFMSVLSWAGLEIPLLTSRRVSAYRLGTIQGMSATLQGTRLNVCALV